MYNAFPAYAEQTVVLFGFFMQATVPVMREENEARREGTCFLPLIGLHPDHTGRGRSSECHISLGNGGVVGRRTHITAIGLRP